MKQIIVTLDNAIENNTTVKAAIQSLQIKVSTKYKEDITVALSFDFLQYPRPSRQEYLKHVFLNKHWFTDRYVDHSLPRK